MVSQVGKDPKIMGVIGVALGTVIPLTITRSFIVPLFCYRTVEVSLGSYFSGIVVPSLVSLVPCTLVQYYLSSRFIPDTYTMGVPLYVICIGSA